jgi:MATE family multidrug resistance protein
LRSYLAARNVTRPLIVAVVIGNIVNAALDAVLIFGVDAIGIPPMGVAGAAIATVSVQIMIVVVYFASVRAVDNDEPRPASTRADILEIVRYGLPVGGQLFAEVGIFGVSTILAANLGTLQVAAHTIALNLASFTFSAALGIGAATSVRVGHAVGSGDIALARRRGLIGLGAGLVVMACFAAMFVIIPGPIARIFTDDPAVLRVAIPLLMLAALFQLSDGTQAIGAGALRGLGDTRATLIGNVIGHYGVGLGISLVCAYHVGLGVFGLWIGLSVGLTVTGVYLVVRFLGGTRPRPA